MNLRLQSTYGFSHRKCDKLTIIICYFNRLKCIYQVINLEQHFKKYKRFIYPDGNHSDISKTIIPES